jgi:hypothetical protein
VHGILICFIEKWEWAIIAGRFLIGAGSCCLAILDIGHTKPVFYSSSRPTESKVWILAVESDHWL